MPYRVCRAALPLLAAFSAGVSHNAAAQTAPTSRPPGVPVADYHAHVSSIEVAKGTVPPLLPAITLRPDLAALIKARENDSDSAVAAQAFREDALLLDTRWPLWVRGRKAIELWLSLTTKGLKFRPVEARTDEKFGYIAGYVVYVAEGEDDFIARNFHMSLEKVDGKWLIATEAWPDKVPPLQVEHDAKEYIAELDAAGIRQGVILSSGFVFGDTPSEASYARVRAENDWTVAQVALYPDRLVAFCGVNPLQPYGVTEVRRCAKLKGVKGIKIHSANDRIDLRKPDHVAALRRTFEAANAAGLNITIHLATDEGLHDPAIASAQVKAFLSGVLPAATAVKVQIAHAYADRGWSPEVDGLFEPFAAAIRANAAGARNLYFDLSASPTGANVSEESLALLAKRMRQVGLDRFLFGSDRSGAHNPPPKDALNNLRRLPLSAAEFEDIADNRMPYLP